MPNKVKMGGALWLQTVSAKGDFRMFQFTQNEVFETKGLFGAAPHRKQVSMNTKYQRKIVNISFPIIF